MPSVALATASLMDDADRYSPALYCGICPLRKECGGIHCKASPFGCDEFCCGQKPGCTTICPNHPEFFDQLAETGGLSLNILPDVQAPPVYLSRGIVPLLYHGSKRAHNIASESVALRLIDQIDFGARAAKYGSRADLCAAFKIDKACGIILTGVDQDPEIERMWALGPQRLRIFREIAKLGIVCATTPNFSMILDVPRADNLNAMKRIAILYNEMCEAGLPAALHVNGRTDQDFRRWGAFLRSRSYISAIAYEFGTGGGLVGRIQKHVGWLNTLQEAADRPLICVLRGNPACLDLLGPGYTPVYIESTSFVKAIKRQSPIRYGNARLRWGWDRQGDGLDVSAGLAENVREVSVSLLARYPALAGALAT